MATERDIRPTKVRTEPQAAPPPLAEGLVNFGLASLSLAMLMAAITLLVGLKRIPSASSQHPTGG